MRAGHHSVTAGDGARKAGSRFPRERECDNQQAGEDERHDARRKDIRKKISCNNRGGGAASQATEAKTAPFQNCGAYPGRAGRGPPRVEGVSGIPVPIAVALLPDADEGWAARLAGQNWRRGDRTAGEVRPHPRLRGARDILPALH
ncbi:hypothetical protein THAOC_08297 [Thalassiosira oceanica]|uniref:Uncharacterized protein n=1 Tax=Thalassiosira oceanica TaxID=159749 RepID=K0SY83_THAOC|nr:hypothetical protein THAOC_08297 [Thalassiosira oceanica]|eukprot:EJK70350.1 hypothetical protein THAOC_08297 [Thalassiosira oceanica]